jgi:hypothetical protein
VVGKTKELLLDDILINFKATDDCDGICVKDPVFDSYKFDYTITVPNEITKLEDIEVVLKNNLQTYKIIGNEDFVVGENEVIVRTFNNLRESKDYNIKVIREANSNANLKNIKFIEPEYEIVDFEPTKYEYNVEFSNLETGRFELEIEKGEATQSYKVGGEKVLYFGMRDIEITVKSESCLENTVSRYGCVEKKYIIHAYRYDKYSNLLESLNVSSGDSGNLLQDFNKYKFEYLIEVRSEIENIKIESIAEDQANVRIEGNGDYKLNIGQNNFKIKVIPEIGVEAEYNVTVIRTRSDNVNLTSLGIQNHELTPEFNKNELSYYTTVEAEEYNVVVNYTKENPYSTVYVSGTNNLETGENVVRVTVISEDKTEGKTYKIYVTKKPSENKELADLRVKKAGSEEYYNLSPVYNKKHNTYEVVVPKTVENIEIEAIKGQKKQTVMGEGIYAVAYGESKKQIVVTSEAGEQNVYEITFRREYNLDLEYLKVKHEEREYTLNPVYNANITSYALEVENDIEYVEIEAAALEKAATIEGVKVYNLAVGRQELVITVNYKNEATRTYTISVTRKANDDTSLRELIVYEGILEPYFESNKKAYELSLPYEYNHLTIKATANAATSTVEVMDNENFEVGVAKQVKVRVRAESGRSEDYVITVIRQALPEASNYLSSISVEEGVLNPIYEKEVLNYDVDLNEGTTTATIHLKAEENRYTEVRVYRYGSTNVQTVDITVEDPKVTVPIEAEENRYIIEVRNNQGIIRNYQLNMVEIGENEARIKSLSFEGKEIVPTFNRNRMIYTMNVESTVNSVKEIIEMVDPRASYTIEGNHNLKSGSNEIIIRTLARNNITSMEYKVYVEKEKDTNAYLKDIITYPEKEFEFNKNQYEYTVKVDSNVSSINVIGLAESADATVEGSGVYDLIGEETEIRLVVTAGDLITRKEYILRVSRKKESEARLKIITTDTGELMPNFESDKTSYRVEVGSEVESIRIGAEALSAKAKVSGTGLKQLEYGENVFIISGVAENLNTKDYVLTVERKTSDIELNELESLRVVEGEIAPEFMPKTTNYVVYIPNEYEKATIIYKASSQSARVTVEGNKNLQIGHNEVKVKVNVTGMEEKVYVIDVVRQQAGNTYLKELSVGTKELKPTFVKETQEYEVEVETETELNIRAIAEDENSKTYIKKNKVYEPFTENTTIQVSTELEEEYHYIKVIGVSKVERVYKLKVVKQGVLKENKLLSLTSDKGTFDKTFDSEIKEYELTVEEGTTNLTLSGTVSEGASVSGLGLKEVKVGSKIELINVTSADGRINTYQITITRNMSSNNEVSKIIPSVGELEPVFNKDVKEYNMVLESENDKISFDVITVSNLARVEGNEETTLKEKENVVLIKVIAEDGSENTYIINVYRKKAIEKITAPSKITIYLFEEKDIEYIIEPLDTDYKEVEFEISKDNNIRIENGKIKPLSKGTSILKIKSSKNNQIFAETEVEVVEPRLSSKEYEIRRDIQTIGIYTLDAKTNYIMNVKPSIAISEVKANFDNEKSLIKMYDLEGNEIVDETK